MATYDIDQVVNPAEITNLNKLNKELEASSSSLLRFIQLQEQYKANMTATAASTASNTEKAKTYQKTLDDTVKSQAALSAIDKELLSQQKQLEAVEVKLTTVRSQSNVELAKSRKQLAEQNEILKLNATLNSKDVGTIEKLTAQNRLLTIEKKKLNLETDEGIKRLKEINDLQDENIATLKATGNEDQKRIAGIGQYKQQMSELVDGFKEGNIGIGEFAKETVKANLQMAKAFLTNPITLIIMGVVGAIALIATAIKRNQAASDGFSKMWGGIKNVFEVLVSRVFQFAGAVGKLFSGDFKGAAESAKAAFTGIGKAMEDAYNAGSKLVEMQQELDKASIKAIESQAKLNAEIEMQSAIADDATLSFEKRQSAAKRAQELQLQQSKENVDLAKQEAAIAKEKLAQAELQGTVSRELQKEVAEANAKVIEAEAAQTKAVFENAKQQRELKSDLFEKDLDILIDGFDKQKTINEQRIADDRLTFEERRKLLEETVTLGTTSFEKQIETVTKFTGAQIDANDLLATSDAVALNQKIRSLGLSEVYEGRLLEVINERKIAIQDFSIADKDLNQAEKDRAKELADDKKEALDKSKEEEQQAVERKMRDTERAYQQELLILRASSKNEEEYQKKKFELDKSIVQASVDNAKYILENSELSALERIKYEEELADKQLELNQMVADDDKAKHDEKLERLKEIQDATIGVVNQIFEVSGAFIDAEMEKKDRATQKELADLEEKKTKGLLSDEEYEKKKTEIERAAAIERAKMERKQAIMQRAQTLFSIAINTYEATAKAIAASPATFGLPFSAFAIASGALSAAAVLAKPLPEIPKFAKGGIATKGYGVFGDAGPELMKTTAGQMYYASKPTYFEGNDFKGAKIWNNKETQWMMSQTDHSGFEKKSSWSDEKSISLLGRIEKAITDKPVGIYDYSTKRLVGWQSGNHTTKILDRYKNGS